MAILYKDAKERYEQKMNAPFAQSELDQIEIVEKKIDEKILKEFDGNEIIFQIQEVNFIQKNHSRRANLMFAEIERKYKSAGWETKTYITDDDGPNRPGYTYWKLHGK